MACSSDKSTWILHILSKRLTLHDSIRRVLVLRSSGIGKSVFGVLLFLLAIKEKKDVAYHPMNNKFTYYFTWNGTEYDISDFPCAGRKYEAYFNGNDKGDALDYDLFNSVFLFASPSSSNYNQFAKGRCFTVFLNPWSKQECEKFAETINYQDEDEWLWRFNLIGGIPRYLFSSYPEFDELVDHVEYDIPHDINELRDQVLLFNQHTFNDQVMHTVFSLYRRDDTSSLSYWTYSSLVIEVIMNARFNIGSAIEILSLLQFPASLVLKRHREIQKFPPQDLATAIFCVKSLEGPDLGHIEQLGPFHANSRIIYTASEIGNEMMLNIPVSKTFPAIDGMLVDPNAHIVIYAQSAVSAAHPIKFHLLKNVYNNLTQRNEFQGYQHMLLFIVSKDDIFDSFHFQPYKDADGKQDCTATIDIKVKQYVGKVDSNVQ